MICKDCGKNLTELANFLGVDHYVLERMHEVVHLREQLMHREDQLEKIIDAARGVIDGWEKNLSTPVQELAHLVPDVAQCPHCEGRILDNLTKDDRCPNCHRTLRRFCNFYKCCGVEWQDDECDSEHNDHCPRCDDEIEPYRSEEVV